MTEQIQGEIPGTERPGFPKIEKAAFKFAEARDKWQEQGKKMEKAQTILLHEMDEEGLKRYKRPEKNLDVEVTTGKEPKAKAKVTISTDIEGAAINESKEEATGEGGPAGEGEA